jgi:quinol monooxygenase YgiN
MSHLRVIARLIVAPENATTARGILGALLAPTRREEGCFLYELLEEIERPGDFTFVETWSDKAALERHLSTPHIQTALAAITPLLTKEPQVRLLNDVG